MLGRVISPVTAPRGESTRREFPPLHVSAGVQAGAAEPGLSLFMTVVPDQAPSQWGMTGLHPRIDADSIGRSVRVRGAEAARMGVPFVPVYGHELRSEKLLLAGVAFRSGQV